MNKNLNKTNVILNGCEGSNSTCHTRPDRVSMDSRIKSENDICGETGRSMVEMLGVLAVIGVLSIGGIVGYNTAMNKHRANDILNAASQRAMVVSAQIQRDANTTPSLAEFGTAEVQGAYIQSATKVGDNQFKLVFQSDKKPATEICTQMLNIVGDGTTGNVRIDSDCTRLLYNNDLSPNVADTNNRTNGSCNTGYAGVDCDSCADGYTKNATTSVCESSEPTGSECSGTTCTAINGTAKCNNGYCECTAGVWVPTSTTSSSTGTCALTGKPTSGCYTNNDCKNKTDSNNSDCGTDGCYCNYNGNVDATNGPTGAGICVQKTTDYHDTITIGNHDYVASYHSSDYFDWWSAKNFCAAYGKHMMSLSDLGCAYGTNCLPGLSSGSVTLFKQLEMALTSSGKERMASWTTTLYSSSRAYYVSEAGYVGRYYTRKTYTYQNVFCR